MTEHIDISANTLLRWLKVPAFAAAYREARQAETRNCLAAIRIRGRWPSNRAMSA
jgi:hypothetical protein